MTTRAVSSLIAVGVMATTAAVNLAGVGQGGGFGGPGGLGAPDVALVEKFDKDGTGWLNTEERKAARESLGTQSAGGRGGFGGRGRGGAVAGGSSGPRVELSSVAPLAASVPLYDAGTVRTFFFEFDAPDWEAELMAFKPTDVEVPGTLTVDGRRYENVGMSFRGNSSFMMVPAGLKHSLNVSLDLINEDQNLLGFRTLNLLNGNGDPSLVRQALFQDIARNYVATPRANFVRVVINGEHWGVYSNVEQINRDFVADRFNGENGVRWKVPGSPGSRAGLEYIGDAPESYRSMFEIKNKDNRGSWDALINLTKVLNTTPPDQLQTALAPILDVDGALKFLALDNVLANSDGYWTRGSDYYLYLDEKGRFHVLPGDTNEALSPEGGRGGRGGGRRGGPFPAGGPGAPEGFGPPPGFGGPLGPGGLPMMGGAGPTLDLLVGLDDPTKPLRSRLLAVPELRARYLAICRDIAQNHLDWGQIGTTARRYQDLIRPHVESDTRKLTSTEEFNTSIAALQSFIEARRTYVLGYAVR